MNATQSSQYRRGTVIGLTLAEVFVLISFILILLLGLWRVQEVEKTERLVKGLGDVASIDLSVLSELISTGLAAPLVESRELQSLVEGVSALPKTEQSSFIELVRASGYEDIASWAHNISAAMERGNTVEDIEDALSLLKNNSPDEINQILELSRKYDLSTLSETAQKADDIEDLLGRSGDASKRFSSELENRAGALVRRLGGRIDKDTGDVTLPEAALFEQGSATLESHTKSVLNSFCFPWLDTAKRSAEIEELRIEGHASSEWNSGDSESHAFVQNMHLSQARASRVLEYCLGNAESIELERWARERLVGVGYSSAKVVRNDQGVELQNLSRRVVFRAGVDYSQLVRSIETKVQE